MQDPPVQERTPAHEEWGSWGDGEGASGDEGAEAEDEGAAAGEGSSSASKSVYQRGMT